MDIYLARQPIFNRHMGLYGYELLYRRSQNNYYEGENCSNDTSELLHNTFLLMDFNKIVDGTKGFINFDQILLEAEIPKILPRDKVVIEVLENVDASDNVIEACKKLKSEGFKIALDDFIFNREGKDYTPLIELADIIKIEFPTSNKREQKILINRYKNKIIFLAEKVETREEYKEAMEIGYELFQGYFFSKPMMIKGKEIGTLNIHLVRILEELQKEDPDFRTISDTIQKDLGLSYKLLSMANSIYYGSKEKTTDLKQAIVRLGIKEMKHWISIMLLREFENDENRELLKMCLLRGQLLKLIAHELKREDEKTDYFFAGIFSSIDVILNNNMSSILESLAVSEKIKEALINKSGELGELLNAIILYEKFEFNEALVELDKKNITMEKFMDIYMEALDWLKTTNG